MPPLALFVEVGVPFEYVSLWFFEKRLLLLCLCFESVFIMYYSEAAPLSFYCWRSFLYALPIGSDINWVESLRRFCGYSLSLSSLMFVSLRISVAAAARATFPLLICPMSGGLRYFCGRDKWCYKLFRPALAKLPWLWLWLTFVVELDLGYPSPDLY